jgi:V/A-type H+-transporting ATPase subunit D
VTSPPLQRAADRRGTSATSWGLSGVEAARRHEEALEVLLRIATREKHLVRLGDEIQETSRRVNALEQLLLPSLAAQASRIEAALEERDREDTVRLKRLRRRGGRAAGSR